MPTSPSSLPGRLAAACFALCCLAFVSSLPLRGQGSGLPVFVSPEGALYETDEGAVALAWEDEVPSSEEGRVYEVRRWSADGAPEGELVYEGMDTATYLSGLAEGDYRLRVRSRSADGGYPDWSEPALVVKVQYIDGRLVAVLMAAGALTFIAIIVSIAMGHRQTRGEERRVS